MLRANPPLRLDRSRGFRHVVRRGFFGFCACQLFSFFAFRPFLLGLLRRLRCRARAVMGRQIDASGLRCRAGAIMGRQIDALGIRCRARAVMGRHINALGLQRHARCWRRHSHAIRKTLLCRNLACHRSPVGAYRRPRQVAPPRWFGCQI
jgi:hypothetical protein